MEKLTLTEKMNEIRERHEANVLANQSEFVAFKEAQLKAEGEKIKEMEALDRASLEEADKAVAETLAAHDAETKRLNDELAKEKSNNGKKK